MIKELKYLFYSIVIFFFIFFTARYYFSDENYKKSYRSISLIDDKIKIIERNLKLLENNTDNIIEFVEYKKDEKTTKYTFWKLIQND
tara:strand:- start:1084 stop:1344 length:261 start_codon:yes stop_codon:yes gene_type:complete